MSDRLHRPCRSGRLPHRLPMPLLHSSSLTRSGHPDFPAPLCPLRSGPTSRDCTTLTGPHPAYSDRLASTIPVRSLLTVPTNQVTPAPHQGDSPHLIAAPPANPERLPTPGTAESRQDDYPCRLAPTLPEPSRRLMPGQHSPRTRQAQPDRPSPTDLDVADQVGPSRQSSPPPPRPPRTIATIRIAPPRGNTYHRAPCRHPHAGPWRSWCQVYSSVHPNSPQ